MKQTILVTGSSSGFGRLTVETLARRGHTVFAAMREADVRNASAATQLNQLAETVPGTVVVVEMDVTNDESVTTAVHQLSNRADHLDAVVNGVRQINEVGARVQREALEGAGIQHLLGTPTG